MGTSANDLDVGINVHADADGIASAERAVETVNHFTATIEQTREAMARSGGDFTKFKQILLELVTAQQAASAGATQQTQSQQAATSAAQQNTTAAQQQAAAWGKVAQAQAAAWAQYRAAQQQATQANTVGAQAAQQNAGQQQQVAQATTQAGAATARAAQQIAAIVPPANTAVGAINKIPASARTAANALSIISLNAVNGTGSLSGFANAAGAAAFGLSQLTGNATLVAGAAGFGAVVTVVGVLIGLFETFEKRREAVSKGLGDLSKDIAGIGVDQLQARLKATDATIADLTKRREALAAIRFAPGNDPQKEIAALADATTNINAIDKRISEVYQQRATLAKAVGDQQAAIEKKSTEATIQANEDALQSYIRRTQGEAAAQRRAIAVETQNQIGAARTSGLAQEQLAARIASIRKEASEHLAQIDQQESAKLAARRTENETRLAKIASDTQVSASKEAFDKSEALNAEQRARRLISEREFIKTRETLELENIGRIEHAQLESINTQIAAQQKLLAATTEPTQRVQVAGQITALQDQSDAVIAGARQQRAKVSADALRDTADLVRKLGETIQGAQQETLEASGHFVEAATIGIRKHFDDLIREAEEAGDNVGAAFLRAQATVAIQQASVKEIDTRVSRAAEASENQIARVNALVSVHAITTREAARQITVALESERDAIQRSIPLLEEQAAKLPGGDPETLARIDAATAKIAQLNAEIAKTSDPLFQLKESARGATTDALSGFFEGLAHLGQQDRSQIRALTGDLKSAQQELHELLAIPAGERSGEVNTRISQLRGEIASTSSELDQAKQSITSWRDLFVSALQSIADALGRVSSQMLATALIEKLLGVAVGASIGSGVSPTLSGGPVGASGVAYGAGGGEVFGPEGIDRVPAMLTAGERVITKPRSQQFGALLDYINFDPHPAPIILPAAIRRYNAGGYVQPLPSPQQTTLRATDRLHVTLDRGLFAAMVKDVMNGTDGRDIVVKHATKLGIR